MILVDANILLYAEDNLSPCHETARSWWDIQLSDASLDQAICRVQSWMDQPCTRLVHPTQRHWTLFQEMLHGGKAVANLVTDAHLAALSVEHGCELISSGADFSRFPGIHWRNPLG